MSEKYHENGVEKSLVTRLSEHPDAEIIRQMIADNDPKLETWESNPRHHEDSSQFGIDRYRKEIGGGLVIDVQVGAGSPRIVPSEFFKDIRAEEDNNGK
jgi:hypothetical protein